MEQNQFQSSSGWRDGSFSDRQDDLDRFYGQGKAWILWDDKEAWRLRGEIEGDFYSRLLSKHNISSVIDISAASGFHVISLARAGFITAAIDGFEGFVSAGRRNVEDAQLEIIFQHARWSDLASLAARIGTFDAAVCLGSSLHHTDQSGVGDLFRDIGCVLNPGAKFIVEQRNYERLFSERPESIDHPCGWRYALEYPDHRTVIFHLKDQARGLDTSTLTTITFENEMLQIAHAQGYSLRDTYYDYGKHSDRAQSWWIQYVFERII